MKATRTTNAPPVTISAAEFGRLVNRSRTRIGQLIRSGVLPHCEGRLVIGDALPRFVEHLDSLQKPSKGRERIEIARADKLELENAITRRDMIPAEEVRRDITRGFTALKTQLLVIPRRLGQPLTMVTDAVEAEERIQKEIMSTLEAFHCGGWCNDAKTDEEWDSRK